MFRSGFRISSAVQLTEYQPSKVQKTAMRASPKCFRTSPRPPPPAGNRSPNPVIPALFPERSPKTTRNRTAPTRKNVRTFWVRFPGLDAEGVHPGQEHDGRGRDELSRGERERVPEHPEAEEGVLRGQGRDEVADELGEGHGQGRDPAAHDEPEETPAVEEPGPGPVGLTDINVLAPGARVHRPELSERQGTADRDEPSGDPDEEHQTRGGELLKDEARRQKDPGPYDGTDDERRGIEEIHPPEEAGTVGVFHGGVLPIIRRPSRKVKPRDEDDGIVNRPAVRSGRGTARASKKGRGSLRWT